MYIQYDGTVIARWDAPRYDRTRHEMKRDEMKKIYGRTHLFAKVILEKA